MCIIIFIIIDITVCSCRCYLLGEVVPWPLVSVQTCHLPYADSFLFLRASVQFCMWITATVQGFGVSFLFLESMSCQQCLARHLFLNGFLPASAWWQSELMADLTAPLWSTAATKKKLSHLELLWFFTAVSEGTTFNDFRDITHPQKLWLYNPHQRDLCPHASKGLSRWLGFIRSQLEFIHESCSRLLMSHLRKNKLPLFQSS